MKENGEICKDCGGFTDEIISMKRDSINVCPECAKKEEYSKYKTRQTIRYMPRSSMKLLPPHPSLCQECGRNHNPEEPHDKQTLYYQTKFHMEHGRYPTWADAMSHCSEAVKTAWRDSINRVKESTEKLTGPKPEGFWD